jgi:hyperosmotically inducible protein
MENAMKRTDLRRSDIVDAQARDAELASNVLAQLVANPVTRNRSIDVDVVAQVVTLGAVVSSAREGAEAMRVALATPGVAAVVDRIRLESELEGVDGHAFRTSVEIGARLAAHPRVHRTDLDIDFEEGIVTLRGIVDDASVVQRAMQIASSVDGVRSVRAQLSVTSRP